MTSYLEVRIGSLFRAVNGRAKFTRDYVDAHPGDRPVYSASLTGVFGYVDEHEYEGRHLTWVMNGYGGRVQEVAGRFSANRDRGVFIPRDGVPTPDLAFLRFAMESQLVAAAVGRRVDGRLNEYTKIYPDDAAEVTVRLPLADSGEVDFERMAVAGDRLRRIEAAQADVLACRGQLARATFAVGCDEPAAAVGLSDERYFELSIGDRVLRSEHEERGIPIFSANARVPFGRVPTSNLADFSRPSLLWGIDGVFDWNLIPEDVTFATTDHCGRLQLKDERLDPRYVFCYLRSTRNAIGFDRVFRASLGNMRAVVEVVVPLDADGEFSLERQRELADAYEARESAKEAAVSALDDVLDARLSTDL